MIKAIIFDIGGVIINDDFLSFFARFEKETGRSKEELYSIFFNETVKRGERGEISADEYWKICSEKSGLPSHVLRDIKNTFTNIFKPIDGSIEIVKKLRGKYKLGTITNVLDQMAGFIKENFSVYKYFDVVILSCEVGMRKPEPGIYKLALERLGIKPEESVFIDNMRKNVEGAKAVGVNGIVFENPERLKQSLRNLGIGV